MFGLKQHTMIGYVAKTYFVRFLVLFVGVAIVLQGLDLLAQSGEVLAGEGAGIGSLWRYAMLRLPQILSELPPFAALLATLITFSILAQHSEIIIMQGAGMSALRIAAPMLLVSLGISTAHFILNETILVNANIELEQWASNDYAVSDRPLPPPAPNAWAIDGNTIIRVGVVTRGGTILDQVTLYKRDADANLVETESASFAAFVDGAWTMFDVTIFSIAEHTISQVDRQPWDTQVPPERFLALAVEPDKVAFLELWRTINDLADEGQSVTMLRSWLNQKIAGPAASLLMPLLGVLAGFGVLRSGLMFLRIAVGMALGFGFFIVDNLLLAFGKFGTLPPFLAAWAPIMLFLLIGLTVVVYAEE